MLAPGPFVPTVTPVRSRRPGARDRRAAGTASSRPVADGDLVGTLAITEPGSGIDPSTVRTTATPIDGGWRLDGRKTGVLGAAEADEIVVVARVGEGRRRAWPRSSSRRARSTSRRSTALDGSRSLASVVLDAVVGAVGPAARRPRAGTPSAASAVRSRRPVVALALETVGTCQTIFDMTLEYAKQREQFGVPIGSFQAIKHKLADMLVALERARATGYFAALAIAEDDDRRATAAATAKIAASRLPASARQGRDPDPRRHRVHVGARHAPVRAPREDRRAAARHRGRAPRAIGDLLARPMPAAAGVA